ncbi:hypothetical protein [Pseudomonas gingeri]|uniref:hypothetical protein n=1 Tax=Pseudomonas gingeri TaxID=117681 RepID=UPI0015A42830|nr:hypothetical protein [Pseudomonas gingeri]
MPGYFRLKPKRAHAANCDYGVYEEIEKIAKSSEDLIESIQHDKYRLRLVMVPEALAGNAGKPRQSDGKPDSSEGFQTVQRHPYPESSGAIKVFAIGSNFRDTEGKWPLVFSESDYVIKDVQIADRMCFSQAARLGHVFVKSELTGSNDTDVRQFF